MMEPIIAALFAFAAAQLALDRQMAGGGAWSREQNLAAFFRELAPVRAYRERERTEELRRCCLSELPVLLDVLTLGLSAGLSFDASLELYCTRYDNDLAEELAASMQLWRMGLETRSEALASLAKRLDIAALQRFSAAVTEALAFGSPLAEVLEHQAQAIRDEHRSNVEEAIEKVPVKMLIPLGTLIVPAMLLAILGPLMGPALQSL